MKEKTIERISIIISVIISGGLSIPTLLYIYKVTNMTEEEKAFCMQPNVICDSVMPMILIGWIIGHVVLYFVLTYIIQYGLEKAQQNFSPVSKK